MRKLTKVAKTAKNLAGLAPADREPRKGLRLLSETLTSQVLGGGGNGTGAEPPPTTNG